MKNLLEKLLSNDVVVRAAKTFVQAFLAVFFVSDNPVSKEVLIAAVAAGVSAVWNFVKGSRS
jgi:hypothetical protein